ncbi:MAG: hypothetical protein BGP25_06400 [Lysobacterales bacterium 63-13]|nr:MAG: hypothetical protein BGP25_06400 [Xanthomonadales bacterium 63-13]
MAIVQTAVRGLLSLVLALSYTGALADEAIKLCVSPIVQVTSSVSIRESPSTHSALVGRLTPGQQVPLAGEVPYWYLVELAGGNIGHVSKRWTDTLDCATSAPVVTSSGASFELDAIDVGTGLSVFVRGPDFTLLYDAGSNDDLAKGVKNRVTEYLATVFPDVHKVDHLVLSHPHRDHVELLADIVRNYHPSDVWDSGAYNDICGYRDFLRAVAEAPQIEFHNANMTTGNETVFLASKTCYGNVEPTSQIVLHHGPRIDTSPIALGGSAKMQFLHIDGAQHSNTNDNSLVLRLELGSHAVMLMGDAEAGGRASPSSTPRPTSVEGKLLECCKELMRADVLIVGHHGSMSSSRRALLDAIGASYYLVSAGPTKYSSVVLPDQVVIDELTSRGMVWRTDMDDESCKTSETKIGEQNDDKAGGCKNVRVTLNDSGVRAAYFP